MLFARLEIADDDRRQRVGALQPHHVAGIEFDVEHIDAFPIGNQIAPVGALRRGQRCGDDLEVDGVVGIGENEQLVATVGDRILHAFLTRRDESRRRFGVFDVDQPLFRCLVIAAGDDAEAAGRALMQMGEPAGILFLIDQRVVGLLGAEFMAPHLHRTMVVVELDVEEATAILAPDDAAVGFLDEVVTIGAISPVTHANREIFRALGVRAPGLELVVVRMPAAAESEVGVGSCKFIAVEHELRLAAMARHAAK